MSEICEFKTKLLLLSSFKKKTWLVTINKFSGLIEIFIAN